MRARLLLCAGAICALAAHGCGGGSSTPPPPPPPDARDAPRGDGAVDRGSDQHADAAAERADAADGGPSDAARDGASDGPRDATDARGDGGPDTAAPTCSDHIKNSDETDIDCGGHCGKCAASKTCLVGADCAFGVCRTDHTCGECNLAADCPGTETECVHRACTAGVCGTSLAAAGTVLAQQAVGDCQSRQCAADGTVKMVADNSDVHDDRNPCTTDTCTGGMPMNSMLPVNSSCGGQNRCNTSGQCVGCLTGTDCPGSDTVCQTRTCTQGVCGFNFKPLGTALTDGTAGDCKGLHCDGAGNSVSFTTNTDVPVDGNPCTTDECTAGTPSHRPVASGTACGTGLVCDGANNCVACLTASTCPGNDTECHTRTCINGACGVRNTAAGTATTAQAPRDCKRVECDGAGATFTVPDVSDLPVDGNPCTSDVCNGDLASNPPIMAGTSCGANLMCDGTGQCVGCITVADCPGMDTACQTRGCTAGKCVVTNVQPGTVVGAQVAGDCQRTQCDTMGNVAPAADPTDLPNDGDSCTIDTCMGGTPTFTPVMVGTLCGDNGGSVCNATGACVGCNVASDCPGGPDTDCHKRVCNAGVCSVMFVSDGTAVASQPPGDCHQNVCDGQGGVRAALDDSDVNVDGNQCTQDLCSNGTPSNPITTGTTCSQNGGLLCDAAGICVQCLSDANCDSSHDTTCNKNHCVAGACRFVPESANTVVADKTPGDCHSNVCDGLGAVAPMVNDNDVPATSSECVVTSCLGGVPSTIIRPHGYSCSQNGGRTCDGISACLLTVSMVKIGAGAVALGNNATATFIEERQLDGTLVSTVTLPSAEGPSHAFGLSGTATSEGGLSLSADGRYLIVAGYNRAATVTGNVVNTTSLAVSRMIARIDASGAVDTSTLLGANPFIMNNVRGATSNDGQEFWVGGAGGTSAGVWYITFGQTTPAPVQVYAANAVRWLHVFDGQLYVTANQDTISSVSPVGTGLPTTTLATPLAPLTGLPAATGPSPFSFVMLDRDATVPGVDTLYIADDSTAAPNQGIQKWTLSAGTWTKAATFSAVSSGTTPTGFRGLAGLVTGASNENVTLVATSGETNGTADRLVVFVDGPSASTTGTVVLTSPTNTAYRGVALSPHL